MLTKIYVDSENRVHFKIPNRFNLSKDETIFFDDREKNVIAANEVGLKAIVFKSIEDIENNLR